MWYYILLLFLCCSVDTVVQARHAQRLERTFALIKPHAVAEGKVDEIMGMIELQGFSIIAQEQRVLYAHEVTNLYKEYKKCSWFRNCIVRMTKSPVIMMVLEKENAIDDWDLCKKNIRMFYNAFGDENVVHGADSCKAALREIGLFFPQLIKK